MAFSARSGAVAILVLALLIAALVRPGSVASPDSVFYIDGARQLARGEGFSISMIPLERGDEPATRLPVSVFPPGFSALLAALQVAGCSPSVARASVELAAYLAYLMLSYLLLLRMVGRETACVFAAVFAIHPGVVESLRMVWSDLPFAAACLGALVLAIPDDGGVRSTDRGRRSISLLRAVAAGVLSAAATLIRYAGLFWAAGLGVAMLLVSKDRSWKRVLPATVALATAACLVAPWLLRNRELTGRWFGAIEGQQSSPLVHLGSSALGLADVVLSSRTLDGPAFRIGYLAVMIPVLALLAARTRPLHPLRARGDVVRAWLVVVLLYGVLLIGSASVRPIDSLASWRFWLPAWPLLLACIAPAYAAVVEHANASLRWLARGVLVSCVAVHAFRLSSPATSDDYLKPRWDESTPIHYARLHERDCEWVANDPGVLLLHTQVDVSRSIPSEPDALDRWLQRGATACIALFEQPPSAGAAQAAPAHGAMLESLRAAGRIERTAKGPGGEVWREIQR